MKNKNSVYLVAPISDETVVATIATMEEMMREGTHRIKLYIASPGGSVSAGLALCDFIRSAPCKITAIAMGCVASMAAIIFLCCDEKIMLKNSTLMLHDILIGTPSTPIIKAETQFEYSKKLKAKIVDIMSERTKLSADKIEDIFVRDIYIDAIDAKKLGMCDHIKEYKDDKYKKDKEGDTS